MKHVTLVMWGSHFIKNNNVICTTYHDRKWTKKNGYKIQGKDFYKINLKNKIKSVDNK